MRVAEVITQKETPPSANWVGLKETQGDVTAGEPAL
jgi:hypothetical protein